MRLKCSSWLGHYDISVDDLLSGIPKEKKSEQAENLILEYLSKGKYPQKELVKKAQAMGISKRVLDEAKKALNVQSVKEGSQWYTLKINQFSGGKQNGQDDF